MGSVGGLLVVLVGSGFWNVLAGAMEGRAEVELMMVGYGLRLDALSKFFCVEGLRQFVGMCSIPGSTRDANETQQTQVLRATCVGVPCNGLRIEVYSAA